MFVLGLTGPTGAGKGEAARCLASLGFSVVDADAVSRLVVGSGDCLTALVREFGRDILHQNGSLNRSVLARLAFGGDRVGRLNAITHPYIKEAIIHDLNGMKSGGRRFALLDAPALFESGLDKVCDRILAVTAPAEERRKRIMLRDGIVLKRAEERMGAQPQENFYTKKADFVIDNSGTQRELEVKVRGVAEKIFAANGG